MGFKDTIKAKAGELGVAAAKGVAKGAGSAAKGAGKGVKVVSVATVMNSGRGIKTGWRLAKNYAETKKVKDLQIGDFIEEGQIVGNHADMLNKNSSKLTVIGENGPREVTKKSGDRVKVITQVIAGTLAIEYDA